MDVPLGASAQDGEMQTVGRGHNHRIRLHLVEHLRVIAEEFDARGDAGLRLLNQFRVRVRNGHQLRIRCFQEGFHPAPHVIVVKADDGEASLRRLGKSHAYSQAGNENQEEQPFHGSTLLKMG